MLHIRTRTLCHRYRGFVPLRCILICLLCLWPKQANRSSFSFSSPLFLCLQTASVSHYWLHFHSWLLHEAVCRCENSKAGKVKAVSPCLLWRGDFFKPYFKYFNAAFLPDLGPQGRAHKNIKTTEHFFKILHNNSIKTHKHPKDGQEPITIIVGWGGMPTKSTVFSLLLEHTEESSLGGIWLVVWSPFNRLRFDSFPCICISY